MLDFPVRETTLDNGLKVLTVEHHEAPITSVWMWYRVGSRNERPGITGISHWVEHMCFKGGAEFGKGDIFREVSKVGGYNNGMTGGDLTVYFETVPSAHGDLGLRIEADRMANARFEPEEVESERTVIISEREGAENHPQFLLNEEVALAALRTHPYRWSVVGWKADLRRITHADLWAHYRQHYAPDNAVLVVAGDFETDALLGDVRRLFGGIEGRAQVAEVRSEEPLQEGERRLYLRRPGTAAYLQVAYHMPSASHPDEPALRVLNSILAGTGPIAWVASPGAGGAKTARLYRALVETRLASQAACNVIPNTLDPGLGLFFATARSGVEPGLVEEAMLEAIERIASQPPTEEEMTRAKTQLAASIAYTGESPTGIAALLGAAEIVDSYHRVRDMSANIAAVTAEDVLRVAGTYLRPANSTIGWFIPTGEPGGAAGTGAPPDFQRFFYTGLEVIREAERVTLDNGLRVVAARCAVTPSVSLAGSIRGGSVLDDEHRAGRARLAASMLQRGTTTRTHQGIFEALDAVGATFGVGAGTESIGFGGNCLAGNLGLLLDIAADVLRNPTFPEDELEKVRGEIITSLRQEADDTRRRAVREARRLLYPAHHPFHVWESGCEETISALTRDDLAAYHALALRPGQAIVALAGDFDPARAVELAAERFADWHAPPNAPPRPDLSAPAPDALLTGDVLMASKTQCDIVLAAPGLPRNHPDYYPFQFATHILGRLGFMGRLGKTVRDELGLCYYCFANMGESDGNAMWFAQAGVNPKNVQLAIDTIIHQVRLMQEDLVSEEEYAELVSNQLGSLAMLLEVKARTAGALLNVEYWDLGADHFERYPDIVRGVSREDILAAARTHLRPDAHVRVVAGPEWRVEGEG